MKKLLLIMCCSLVLKEVVAQQTIQNMYFHTSIKQHDRFNESDYDPSRKRNFYIYRNCVYRFRPSAGGDWVVKVTDIRNDSIYFVPYGPILGAKPNNSYSLHPSDLGGITRVSDRLSETYKAVDLFQHWHVFTQDSIAKAFPVQYATIPNADSGSHRQVEIVPYLIGRGLMPTYLKCGEAYYYDSLSTMACNQGIPVDSALITPVKTRDGIWFTPSRAERINGLNIGLLSMQLGDHPVAISGVNLNADLMGLLFFMYSFFIPADTSNNTTMPDTLSFASAKNKISGLSISAGGLTDEFAVAGISINGLIAYYTSVKGISVTGLTSNIDEFHGICIGGIKNHSVKGYGLQVGLLNKCKFLRGVQVGIWNVNSKRKLPLINWDF